MIQCTLAPTAPFSPFWPSGPPWPCQLKKEQKSTKALQRQIWTCGASTKKQYSPCGPSVQEVQAYLETLWIPKMCDIWMVLSVLSSEHEPKVLYLTTAEWMRNKHVIWTTRKRRFNHQLCATLVLQLWYKICKLTVDPGNPTSPVFPDLPDSPWEGTVRHYSITH